MRVAHGVLLTFGVGLPTMLTAPLLPYQHIDDTFPNLESYRVLQPPSDRFNCIAWSFGIQDRWIEPACTTVAGFTELNEKFGFKRSSHLNCRLEAGVQKIVLFGRQHGGQIIGTHQARQLPDGTWSSKLGNDVVILYDDVNELIGEMYGKPVAMFVRQH